MGNTVVKMNYYALLAESDHEEIEICEVDLVSVWPCDGFNHTSELHVMKHKEGTYIRCEDKTGDVWELLCHLTMTHEQHYKIMLTMMNYFVGTRNQGLFLKSMKNLDGKDMLFEEYLRY